jgi:hypothetical protein
MTWGSVSRSTSFFFLLPLGGDAQRGRCDAADLGVKS